jgi:mono/diheme cytochrome c family protein
MRLTWSLGTLVVVGMFGAILGALEMAGLFDSSASNEYSVPTAWAIHRTMIDSVALRSRAIKAPPRFTEAQVIAGFHSYEAHCVMCHGGPGVGRQPWVAGMNPTPPYLVDAAERWKPEELYVAIHDGVKMTGMPAWGRTRSKAEIWGLVAFLEALPKTSTVDYARLRMNEAEGSLPRPRPLPPDINRTPPPRIYTESR